MTLVSKHCMLFRDYCEAETLPETCAGHYIVD